MADATQDLHKILLSGGRPGDHQTAPAPLLKWWIPAGLFTLGWLDHSLSAGDCPDKVSIGHNENF